MDEFVLLFTIECKNPPEFYLEVFLTEASLCEAFGLEPEWPVREPKLLPEWHMLPRVEPRVDLRKKCARCPPWRSYPRS
tara:strand:- start:31 stop:267 length:237 start_codon:yes stop_codon:yes gene_type:complete